MVYKNFIKILLIVFLSFSLSGQVFANSQKVKKARNFIHKFQKLSHKYDKNLINMYSDRAKIVRLVEHSDGKTEKVMLPVRGYKKMLEWAGFWAKMKGYKNYYKDLDYKMENENIRITGKRVTTDGYKAPISILVGKSEDQEWKILEEKTKTDSVFLIKQVFTKMN